MTKGARYITIPIFVACLTVADIGTYSVLQAITMICWAVSTLGFGAAVRRYYSDSEGVTDDLLIGTLWRIRLIFAAIPVGLAAVGVWLFANSLEPLLRLIRATSISQIYWFR